jgi:hypothetical protein
MARYQADQTHDMISQHRPTRIRIVIEDEDAQVINKAFLFTTELQ